MKKQQEITFQSLTANGDVQIGYSDNDIVVVEFTIRVVKPSECNFYAAQ